MGCRILYDEKAEMACLFCSTSDTAFGPVFADWKDRDSYDRHDAHDRADAFLRWLQDREHCPWSTFDGWDVLPGRDARHLTDSGLQAAYTAWLAQEADQWQREQQKEEVEP